MIVDRAENDIRCQQLLRALLSGLGLEFRAPSKGIEDGWYVWRLHSNWPIDCYAVYEVVDGMIQEPEPADSFGSVLEMTEYPAYGELAGPILGR